MFNGEINILKKIKTYLSLGNCFGGLPCLNFERPDNLTIEEQSTNMKDDSSETFWQVLYNNNK